MNASISHSFNPLWIGGGSKKVTYLFAQVAKEADAHTLGGNLGLDESFPITGALYAHFMIKVDK